MANLAEFMTDFDDSAIPASTGVPEPVPEGEYMVQQEKSELVETKNKDGLILKVTLTVVQGQYEGRKIFPQFNIRNKNMQAQQIGIGEFKAMCLAAGVDYEQAKYDTSLLDYKPFRARVGFDKQQINPTTGEPYPPKNRVMKFISADDQAPAPAANAVPAKPAVAAQARPAAAPATGQAGLPWQKKSA